MTRGIATGENAFAGLLALLGLVIAAAIVNQRNLAAVAARIGLPHVAPAHAPARPHRSPATSWPKVDWRKSVAVGLPNAGRLVDGVQLPASSSFYVGWMPGWRRWGTDRLVRTVLTVLSAYRRAHPHAARVVVGDLSLPQGGFFGSANDRGHVSHQNGLDVDVYYPRSDRAERPPAGSGGIDYGLAQDLVDRFVRAGAQYVFVGPATGLRGPPAIVRPWPYHDEHMHVRIYPAAR